MISQVLRAVAVVLLILSPVIFLSNGGDNASMRAAVGAIIAAVCFFWMAAVLDRLTEIAKRFSLPAPIPAAPPPEPSGLLGLSDR